MRGSLALSEAQMRLVQRAAASLPVERRDQFLLDVAARLGDGPTRLAVEAAIGAAVERTAMFLCDRAATMEAPDDPTRRR